MINRVTNQFTFLLIISFSLVLLYACKPANLGSAIDRNSIPAVDVNIPVTASEIREIKYTKQGKENDHEDLHLAGQIFTKSNVNGNTVIKPCSGCIVRLNTPEDTSTHANLTTEPDGYFSFHGKNMAYSLLLNNPGYNRVELSSMKFNSEGVTTFKIINAAGSSTERFNVSMQDYKYTWQLVSKD